MSSKNLSFCRLLVFCFVVIGVTVTPLSTFAEELTGSSIGSLSTSNSAEDVSCTDSLVHIVTNLGCANGFCLKQKDGSLVILTCYRGIAGAPSAEVLLAKSSSFSVKTCLAYDEGKDLLILPVPDGQPLKSLQLASEDRENRTVTSYSTLSGGQGALLQNLHFKEESGKVKEVSSDELWTQINTNLETDDECKRLGLSPSVRWLSSDILVQKENRGNPLIDFTGRVVGVNSWSRINDKLEMNQAIPPSEIRPLLDKVTTNTPLAKLETFPVIRAGSKYVKSVEWLPGSKVLSSRSRRGTSPPSKPGHAVLSRASKSADRQCVKFYSGKSMPLDSMCNWDSRLETFKEYEGPFFGEGLNRSGKIEGMAGGTLETAENLRFLGNYQNGLRDGTFHVWQKRTIPVIQCRYDEGKLEESYYLQSVKRQGKQAVACLFAAEYQGGKLQRIHHFSEDGNHVLASYDSPEAMKTSPDVFKQWESMEAIDLNLNAAEHALKKEAEKVVDAAKRAKSAVLNQAKRKAMSQRQRARQATEESNIRQLKKWSGW